MHNVDPDFCHNVSTLTVLQMCKCQIIIGLVYVISTCTSRHTYELNLEKLR